MFADLCWNSSPAMIWDSEERDGHIWRTPKRRRTGKTRIFGYLAIPFGPAFNRFVDWPTETAFCPIWCRRVFLARLFALLSVFVYAHKTNSETKTPRTFCFVYFRHLMSATVSQSVCVCMGVVPHSKIIIFQFRIYPQNEWICLANRRQYGVLEGRQPEHRKRSYRRASWASESFQLYVEWTRYSIQPREGDKSQAMGSKRGLCFSMDSSKRVRRPESRVSCGW